MRKWDGKRGNQKRGSSENINFTIVKKLDEIHERGRKGEDGGMLAHGHRGTANMKYRRNGGGKVRDLGGKGKSSGKGKRLRKEGTEERGKSGKGTCRACGYQGGQGLGITLHSGSRKKEPAA